MQSWSAKSIITADKTYSNAEIILEKGIIVDIIPCAKPKFEVISPMLFDIHINGGYDFHFTATPDKTTVADIAQSSLDHGTFFTLPTIITSTLENMVNGIRAVKHFMQKNPNSGVLGIHLEGPFLNPIKKGAHLEAYIIKPTKENIDLLLSEGKDIIKMWTIAPEMFDSATLDYLVSIGVTLSIGHSNATYEEATQAMDKGIKLVTHLYNAMSPMNHRAPGLVGAALNHPNVTCQIILDGLHCHQSAAEIALKIKNDQVILVSDALFLGRKKQSFQWDNFNATLTNGTYYNADGNLAGSAISQLDAILFAVKNLHISPDKALRMASIIPLQMLNIPDQLWDIKVGNDVGFVGFDGEWGFEYLKDTPANFSALS